MELIIGRDGPTSMLKVVNGKKTEMFGKKESVPHDVSRQHCSLTIIDENTFVLKSLNANNSTWVNGMEVQSKRITAADNVQLGAGRYTLPLTEILERVQPKVADIRPLKAVWENYNNGLIAIRKRQQLNGLLSSIPIGFTMLGGLVSGLGPESFRTSAYIFTAIAFVFMVYGLFRRFTDKSIEQQEELKQKFQKEYVCPKCKRFLGFQDYYLISQYTNCPNSACKVQFKS